MRVIVVTDTFWSDGYYESTDRPGGECSGSDLPEIGWAGFVGCDCHNRPSHVERHEEALHALMRGEARARVIE